MDKRARLRELASKIVYMNEGLKSGQAPPDSHTYNGENYGKDILLTKVLTKA